MSVWSGIRPLLVCSALLAASQGAFAQAAKVAVVNMQAAVFGTAEIKKADADLAAQLKPRQEKAQALQNEIANISQQLQQGGSKLTPQQAQDLSDEGQRKQRELQRMNDDLQSAADQARQDVIPAITKKMKDVVTKLAEEKGLDLVVDTSTVVFNKPALDLTSDAIAAYDKTYPVAAAPAGKK
jgi:outer membrane protein